MNVDEEIAERFKVAVKKAGGNSAVSERLGVNPETVSRYGRLATPMTLNAAITVCDMAGVSVDWLVNGEVDSTMSMTEDVAFAITQAGQLAKEIASRSDRIEFEPEAFGQTFQELLEHMIRKEITEGVSDNVVDFAFEKISRR